jgi:hypothetical protein
MPSPDEIRRAEAALAAAVDAVRIAEAALAKAKGYHWSSPNPVAQALRNRDAPPLESATSADARWNDLLKQAEAMMAQGKPVSGEFITAAGERARAGQRTAGQNVGQRKVIPLHQWRGDMHADLTQNPKDRK